jgi:cold-inducible RNA-binding protein
LAYETAIRYTGHAAEAEYPRRFKTHHTKERVISNKIFVGNLSFTTTEQELSQVLSEVGRVVRCHIGTDRETGRSRGFAFVEYGTDTEAADAIRRFDGYDLGGRRLRVNDADDRPPARSGGGGAPRPAPAPQIFNSAPRDMFGAGDPFGNDSFGAGAGRPARNKGSRRNLRARKRSLGY